MTDSSPHLQYFNTIASSRITYRKKRSYYWNDISRYCSYFIHEDSSVLDIGCGTGELLGGIKARKKTGIDFSETMIENARQQFPNVDFRVMSAEDIRLDEQFDVVILSNVIGFLDDVEKVLKEIHRICHPHTKIIITYYNYLWEPLVKIAEWAGIKKKTPPQNWLTREDIGNLLYLAGFEEFRTAGRMLLPMNIPLISWLLNRIIATFPVINWFALNSFSFARPLQQKGENSSSVSIIIPARNESGNIEDALRRIQDIGKSTEIIFVEGHSTDDTWEKIQQAIPKFASRFKILSVKQDGKGKANAVRKGFELATGDILIILDADLTVPPEDLPKFYEAIVTGRGEFINGSRLVYPVHKQAMRFLNLVGNRFFGFMFSWLLDQEIKDTLCGTKVLWRSDYLKIKTNRSYFGDFDPFGDYDLLFGAHKLNLKIVELPVRYRPRKYGTTNISRFTHGLLLLKMCWFAARKIKFN